MLLNPNFKIRPATITDLHLVKNLYLTVSQNPGGLARTADEITSEHIDTFTTKALKTGFQFVAENLEKGKLVAEIHCYKPGPKVFDHILSELTIAVHPEFQSKGIGRLLFDTLLKEIEERRKDILRVELIARESNKKAISFYQSLGFEIEGKLLNRIKAETHQFEADIPHGVDE